MEKALPNKGIPRKLKRRRDGLGLLYSHQQAKSH
jgi:hypothetical protein